MTNKIYIVNHVNDDSHLVRKCVESVKKFDFEPVIVRSLEGTNRNKNNILRLAESNEERFAFIIDSDCELLTDPRPMIDVAADENDCAIVGCGIVKYEDGKIIGWQDSGARHVIVDSGRKENLSVPIVCGNFMLVRTGKGLKFGGRSTGRGTYGDTELCIEAGKSGYKIYTCLSVRVKHMRPFGEPNFLDLLRFRIKYPKVVLNKWALNMVELMFME